MMIYLQLTGRRKFQYAVGPASQFVEADTLQATPEFRGANYGG